jgi:hypothetical protein
VDPTLPNDAPRPFTGPHRRTLTPDIGVSTLAPEAIRRENHDRRPHRHRQFV